MNKLLERQIRRKLKGIEEIPEDFKPLLEAISDSYDHYEADRGMLDRSLELSSQELNNANNLIRSAKEEIEAKNKDIMDSIRYAKRIQEAILPDVRNIRKGIPNSFVLFRPKDIVSGDFFWYYNLHPKHLISAVDCTGHGVPGAFMSMIGNDLLNHSVIEKGHINPGKILESMDIGLGVAMKHKGGDEDTADGMDMALCCLDLEKKSLTYSGAFRPLIIIRNKEVIEYKANKFPIGKYDLLEKSYEEHTIQLEDGDSMYIFSDGYPDQFGGEKGKKFMNKKFKELLIEINDQNMDDQRDSLENELIKWMGDMEQVDDITVIGFKV